MFQLHCLPFAIGVTLASFALAQSPLTPGNLCVSRVGDGAAALTNAATARFLDEYTPAGVFVQTVALPTSVSGSNRSFTDSGTATSNGFITQSVDGRYLLAAGYDAVPGTASVTGSASATINRVIARIALDGTIDTSTALNDAYNTNNFRGVVSVDGSAFWTSGTGTGTSPGVRYVAALGANVSTQLSTTVTNIRCLNIAGDQLYCSSSSGAFVGVSTVGVGLPAIGGQTIAALPGFPVAAGPSAYDFFFADANTVYVADDRLSPAGGIQKWTLSAGTWALAFTLNPAANIGCRGVSGFVENGVTTLFAITTSNLLVTVTDTGPASPFSTLVTAATNTALRDVQFVRTPASLTWSGTACATTIGTPTVGTGGGSPVTGNLNFAITAGNAGAGALVVFLLNAGAPLPFGVGIPGAPPCALAFVIPAVLAGTLSDLSGNAATALPIPANASLGGADLAAQVAVFDPALLGFALPIGTSDALHLVIGN